MDKNQKSKISLKNESMLIVKTNQDYNNQKPSAADPNQTENHQAEKNIEIEYEPNEEKVRKGAKGNGLYIGDEDKSANGIEYYYSNRTCSARTKDLRREYDAQMNVVADTAKAKLDKDTTIKRLKSDKRNK
jgi:hypothetical protein